MLSNELFKVIADTVSEENSEYYKSFSENTKAILLENINFLDSIIFDENIELELILIFNNCKFEENVSFEGPTLSYIHFANCEFQKDFLIRDGSFKGDFVLTDTNILETFYIYGGRFSDFRFNRSNCARFYIKGGTIGEVSLYESKINRALDILGGSIVNLHITKSEVVDQFNMFDCEVKESVSVANVKFDCSLNLSSNKFLSKCIFSSCYFYRSVYLADSYFSGGLEFKKCKIYRISIDEFFRPVKLIIDNDCEISSVLILGFIQKETIFHISGLIFLLEFRKVINNGVFIISDVKIGDKHKFTRQDDVEFDFSKTQTIIDNSIFSDNINEPEIRILSSDLGKTTIVNSDLSNFRLLFYSSKITDVFIAGSKMPSRIVNDDVEQRQLGYSQIKKIYDNRGDKVQANFYLSEEMNAYYDTLNWKDNFWEKLNLFANKFSTNHGQSWSRGLLTTILVSSLFYILYCFQLGIRPTYFYVNGDILYVPILFFGKVASYFIEFVNPIHKADYIADEIYEKKQYVSGWARFTEGISRIFIAYFVYQLVQAFRKHGKS